jgi:hypothetical protein
MRCLTLATKGQVSNFEVRITKYEVAHQKIDTYY